MDDLESPRLNEEAAVAEDVSLPNFGDTQIAFQNKSDDELKEMYRLFLLMNNSMLVDIGTVLTRMALRLRLPFIKTAVKRTIFRQFCGGVNLMDCQDVIDHLYKHNALAILDYGAESKSLEADLDQTKRELLKGVEFAASNNSVPVISSKLTALVDNELLIVKQGNGELSKEEKRRWGNFESRITEICKRAHELDVGVFIDAEESWMQEAMDEVVESLMMKFNKNKVIVYNTYQLYRKDKLLQLKEDYKKSQDGSYLLGAKLVRGAYMDKEREWAQEKGIDSLIHKTKNDTDRDFDEAIIFCLERYEKLAFCCASHNLKSNMLLAEQIMRRKIAKDHPNINFCQLQGMSDYITFNLAMAGFNVAKYIVYGPVVDVVEYLTRRAEENTSVTGEMSRELKLVNQEMKRRGL